MLFGKIVAVLMVTFALWSLAAFFLMTLIEFKAKKENRAFINNQELQKILIEEKHKLGMDSYNISVALSDEISTCRVTKIKQENNGYIYQVFANKKWAGKYCVKHELYHVYKNHFIEQSYTLAHAIIAAFTVYFINEPMANFYAIFG